MMIKKIQARPGAVIKHMMTAKITIKGALKTLLNICIKEF